MASSKQHGILLVALSAVATLLQGCTFGTEESNCDGDTCACSLSFKSFWARISVSGVHIEHASRTFYIPDVARDVVNATSSPCCSAIFDQIDYDEGKSSSEPNKILQGFNDSCHASPNKEIAAVAASSHSSVTEPSAAVRQLNSLRKLAAPVDRAGKATVGGPPIPDGQDGQDCYLDTTKGFNLSSTLVTSGSMKLRIRWVDPEGGNPACCNSLRPLLQNVYIDGLAEGDLSADVKSSFCNNCKKSPNQGIALAAYRCFGADKTVGIDV